jgi:phage-related protein
MCCCEVPDLGQCKPLELRPVTFHDAARAEVRAMPKPARSAFGKLLLKLQCGESLSMPHSRPMPNIAAGVAEIRIADASGHYRVFYWKSLATGILVVHAFM